MRLLRNHFCKDVKASDDNGNFRLMLQYFRRCRRRDLKLPAGIVIFSFVRDGEASTTN